MYPFERFTEDARKALVIAQEEAARSGDGRVGTEHVLLGLLSQRAGEAASVLRELGVGLEGVRRSLAEGEPAGTPPGPSALPPAEEVRRLVELAFTAAREEGVQHVGTMHLLAGLMRLSEGRAAAILTGLGVQGTRVKALRAHQAAPAADGWPAPGDRVLVHDPDPPYRLWEGRAGGAQGGLVQIAVPGHPDRAQALVPAGELHAVPLTSSGGCDRCRYRAPTPS